MRHPVFLTSALLGSLALSACNQPQNSAEVQRAMGFGRSDQAHGQAFFARTTGTADAVNVDFRVARQLDAGEMGLVAEMRAIAERNARFAAARARRGR